MRLARKLFLLTATVITALALSATAASAQVDEVIDEETGTHCTAVTLVGHTVSGGCHIEYESEAHIPLVAHVVPTPVVVSICDVHLEAQIGETGEGYVTEAVLTTEDPATSPPCTRAACDETVEAGHATNPWPIHIDEEGPGAEQVEAVFCLRTVASGEGGAGSQCEVHLPFTQNAGHNHEIGDTGGEYFCEGGGTPPVSIRNAHFINENPAEPDSNEDIVIVH